MWALYLLFGVLPYIAFLVFVAGIVYRIYCWTRPAGLTGMYSVNVGLYESGWGSVIKDVLKRIFLFYTLSDREKDRPLFYGSLMFHWGIWIALIGHLGIVVPEPVLSRYFGITPQLHHAMALYVGGAGGIMALSGLLILTVRRMVGASSQVRVLNTYTVKIPIRDFSFIDDYFADAVLLSIIALGLSQTLGITPFHPSYIGAVASWAQSLILLHPNVRVIQGMTLLQAHALLAMIFIAYFPWGKMIHPFSYLFMPTISRPGIKVKGYVV